MVIPATYIVWLSFFVIFVGVLTLDLGLLHRDSRVLSIRQAMVWTVIWIFVALLFGGLIYCLYEYRVFGWHVAGSGGRNAFTQYATGYLLEWSLSIDNIFIIALILTHMKIPIAFQYRVLFWGIVGAIALRGAMIALGVTLIHAFDWMFYVFGGILLISALRMLRDGDTGYDPSKSKLLRIARQIYPVSSQLDGERFFTRIDGRHAATPLFLTLLIVDFADVIFAVDSIPAIFAVTQDPFIVFTSNAFAVLGLRSLYFVIAGLMTTFRYLKISLVFILVFIAIKLILINHYAIPDSVSLLIIAATLGVGVLASWWRKRQEPNQPPIH